MSGMILPQSCVICPAESQWFHGTPCAELVGEIFIDQGDSRSLATQGECVDGASRSSQSHREDSQQHFRAPSCWGAWVCSGVGYLDCCLDNPGRWVQYGMVAFVTSISAASLPSAVRLLGCVSPVEAQQASFFFLHPFQSLLDRQRHKLRAQRDEVSNFIAVVASVVCGFLVGRDRLLCHCCLGRGKVWLGITTRVFRVDSGLAAAEVGYQAGCVCPGCQPSRKVRESDVACPLLLSVFAPL